MIEWIRIKVGFIKIYRFRTIERNMKVKNNLMLQNKCLGCELRTENFFCELSRASLETFQSLKITIFYPKGARLFFQGQHSTGIYMLCQGRVKLTMCSKEGREIILHIAEAGEVLGLNAAVSDSVHIATAETLKACQVNFVGRHDFLRFLRENSEASNSAVRHLSRQYDNACRQIHTLGLSESVADKLAMLFLSWSTATAENGKAVELKVSYTHEEIAQMIGTSRETVTRLLKRFRERRLISGAAARLTIPDREELAAFIGAGKKENARRQRPDKAAAPKP